MYAVFVTGGKQHRVAEGDTLKVEKLEAELGSSLEFDQVLMTQKEADINVGAPTVAGAKVVAEVVAHGRHKKIHIIKFKRRKHHMKQAGHRQWYTELKITGIQA